jgi:hypothetical protein
MKFKTALALLTASAFIDGASASGPGFRMPSGHTQCEISPWENKSEGTTGLSLNCNLTVALPLRGSEDSCHFSGFTLDENDQNVADNCESPAKPDESLPVLAYGSTWSFDNFACKSQTDGVVCQNKYAGFQLSMSRQTTFKVAAKSDVRGASAAKTGIPPEVEAQLKDMLSSCHPDSPKIEKRICDIQKYTRKRKQ